MLFLLPGPLAYSFLRGAGCGGCVCVESLGLVCESGVSIGAEPAPVVIVRVRGGASMMGTLPAEVGNQQPAILSRIIPQWGTADAEMKHPPPLPQESRAIKGSFFLSLE